MDYCIGCYYIDKELTPCLNCICGNKSKSKPNQADKIRSMTDEELAKWLTEITDDAQLDVGTKCNYQWDEFLKEIV